MKPKPTPTANGFFCAACGKRTIKTVDSRPTFGGIRRRKECTNCGHRFSTIEHALTSLKSGGVRRVQTHA